MDKFSAAKNDKSTFPGKEGSRRYKCTFALFHFKPRKSHQNLPPFRYVKSNTVKISFKFKPIEARTINKTIAKIALMAKE